MAKNKPKLYFYDVDLNYINYLKKFEPKIPNISYNTNNKFLCGVVFQINNDKYYVPVSSFNKQQKTNFLIINNGVATSSLRFSFMFPVPDNLLTIKDFNKEDKNYRSLLIQEWIYCNAHFNDIQNAALKIYNEIVSNPYSYLKDKCCDFKLLETKCREYINQQNTTQTT